MLDCTPPRSSLRSERLRTGRLDLQIKVALEGDDIFRIAERINPKRSFLFVSTLLGRHIPVRPSDHFGAIDKLVGSMNPGLSGTILVMGYAETAVGIGAGVARAMSRRFPRSKPFYLSTTRHPIDGRHWMTMEEGHSHATTHHVLHPEGAPEDIMTAPLVLVDDEVTTGSTFAGLCISLRDSGFTPPKIIMASLKDWSDGRAKTSVAEIFPDADIESVSLLKGEWSWERDENACLPEIPVKSQGVTSCWHPTGDSPDHRTGIRDFEVKPLDVLLASGLRLPGPDQEVLVIGTGEHVWLPMLLAEEIEMLGFDVRFVATTRSPIVPGEAITSKAIIADHFGMGFPMYLHNVPRHPDQHVIVVTETGPDGICENLRSHLGAGQIICGRGLVREF